MVRIFTAPAVGVTITASDDVWCESARGASPLNGQPFKIRRGTAQGFQDLFDARHNQGVFVVAFDDAVPASLRDGAIVAVPDADVGGKRPAASAGPVLRAFESRVQDEPRTVTSDFQPDFVDIGMGPTGMMAMLAAVASGRTAAGVEVRGAPTLGIHQNIRPNWFHMLGKIDEMMLSRYGHDGVPKLPNGEIFKLADFFFNPDRPGGSLEFDRLWNDFGSEQRSNIGGRLKKVAFSDARNQTLEANGGIPTVVVFSPPEIPTKPDPSALSTDMAAVLDAPSTFQASSDNYQKILRKYLELIEAQDSAAGKPPRVKLYTHHRVVEEDGKTTGFIDAGDGKKRILIEEIEMKASGGRRRPARKPGTPIKDLGVPVKFAITTGSTPRNEAKALGYRKQDVVYVDSTTGERVVPQQTWIAGEITAHVGGQLVRRISTEVDPRTGNTETVRQIAVGHEDDPEVGWILVQVPDFLDFDPVAEGIVAPDTDPTSETYTDAAQQMLYDFYIRSVAATINVEPEKVARMRIAYGPALFTVNEQIGESAKVATNGVVAGDLMANGHFLTSGGAMTGMIGHAQRFLEYWKNQDEGVAESEASQRLEDGILKDSRDWLHVSAKEFFDVAPINFGHERASKIVTSVAQSPVKKPNDDKVPDAKVLNADGTRCVASTNWARTIALLEKGYFGVAGVDFFVPLEPVDITKSPSVIINA